METVFQAVKSLYSQNEITHCYIVSIVHIVALVLFFAPLAHGQQAYVMARCPSVHRSISV